LFHFSFLLFADACKREVFLRAAAVSDRRAAAAQTRCTPPPLCSGDGTASASLDTEQKHASEVKRSMQTRFIAAEVR
jgi:hypothetical protein